MSKKTIILGAIVISVIALFLLLQIFSNESKRNLNVDISNINMDSVNDEEVKNILKEIETASQEYKQQEKTTIDKIYEDWVSGKIDSEKYFLMSLEAIYGGVISLPEKYKGAQDTSKDHAFLYGFINSEWDNLSKDTREKIRPFLLPPQDPKSYFYGKAVYEEELSEKVFNDSNFVKPANAQDINIEPIKTISVMPKIDVNYFEEKEKPQAEWAAQGVRDSIPKFKDLLGIEHKTIQIIMVGKELGADGQASIDENDNSICHVKVRRQKSEKGVKTTTAHEIFHCYQFWYGLKYEKPDTMWLMETTATWSEDYVYRGYNTEHLYLPEFFPKMNIDIMSIENDHEYGSYLWYHFLEQRLSAQEIVNALRAGRTDGIRANTQSREKFGREYRDFTLWNWNRQPFKNYMDDPTFPSVYPYWQSVTTKDINNLGETSYPIDLAKGGMLYNFITFNNENIKSIEFYPKNFTGEEENTLAGLQVFYKVNGNWNYEDWTGVEKRNFCRQLPEENIELIVLAASNANLSSSLNKPILIKTDNKCAPGWKGSIDVKWENSNSLSVGASKASYMEKGAYHLYETLEYDSEDNALVVADQQYFANLINEEKIENSSKECGQLWSIYSKKISGSGFVDYKKTNNMPERVEGEDSDDISKLGGDYDLIFKIFGLKNGDKFYGSDLRLQMHKKCSPTMPGADGLVKEPYEYKTDSFGYEPADIKIKIDSKARNFQGEEKFQMRDNVFGTVKWNYQKID